MLNMRKNILLIILAVITALAVAAAISLYCGWEESSMEGELVSSENENQSSGIEQTSLPSDSEPEPSSSEQEENDLPEGSLTDFNLILLGPQEENKIETELSFEKTKFDTQYVDSRAASAYEAMCNAALEEGITLYLRSGYRSIETQRTNYNASIQRNMDAGYSEAEAIEMTNMYYTVPGHSEHHTGLAFDIITPEYHNEIYTLDDRFADTAAYVWLREHASEYGFILRYPKEKEELTQIAFEPWHYRYVGVEHAKYIEENGLCLEEYIDLLRESGR